MLLWMRTIFRNKIIFNIENKKPSVTKSLFVLLLNAKCDTHSCNTSRLSLSGCVIGDRQESTEDETEACHNYQSKKGAEPYRAVAMVMGPNSSSAGVQADEWARSKGEVAGSSCSNHFHRSPLFLHEDSGGYWGSDSGHI